MRCIAITVFLFSCVLSLQSLAADGDCAKDNQVIAACYDIHARLSVHTNLRMYLWPIGTKRLLAVADFSLPPNVKKMIDPYTDVFGDFHVCPFTPDESNKLRMVCIDSASHLVATLYKNDKQNNRHP